jgi:hypothetical protein
MENKVPYLPITLSEFRIIQLAKEGLPKLLLGLIFLLVLNSCSKDTLMEPSDPYQELKQWYAFNKMTSTNEPVLWKYTLPFAMPDSSQAYQIPVMSKVGMKDLIIYSENGIQKGFYKLYTPKDETHINIQVLNMFDEVILDGVLTKTKRVAKPRKKNELDGSTIREMNLDLPEVFCYGQRLPMEGTLMDLPVIYSEGGGSYYPSIPSFFGGGGGAPSSDAYDINFDPSAELLFSIGNNVKNKCLLEALNGVINSKYDLKGIIKDLKLSNKTVYFYESTSLSNSDLATTTAQRGSQSIQINLNLNILPSCSKELIAAVIYHELMHAYFISENMNMTEDEEHNEMGDYYIDSLYRLLNIRFPKYSEFADELRFVGLTKSNYFKDHVRLGSRETVGLTIESFKNGNNGTYCK